MASQNAQKVLAGAIAATVALLLVGAIIWMVGSSVGSSPSPRASYHRQSSFQDPSLRDPAHPEPVDVKLAKCPWLRSPRRPLPVAVAPSRVPWNRSVASLSNAADVLPAALPWREARGASPDGVEPAKVPWQRSAKGIASPSGISLATVPWRPAGLYAPVQVATASVPAFPLPAPLEKQRRQEEVARAGQALAPITLTADFEGAAPLKIARLSNTHFVIDFEDKFANWFIFKVEGAKGKTIRVDLQNVALNKWSSLNPVYSYAASLDDPDVYVTKPSTAATTQPVAAHNGPLLPDTSGQQWHYIANVWPDRATKTLSFVQTFEADHAYVAMKAPYTPKLAEAYIARLEKNPLAKVITVGKSKEGRPLRIVKIGGGSDEEEKAKPCILMYAREHANEQDTSWVVQGAVDFLLSNAAEAKAIRGKFTVLLIPLLDPDGAVGGVYENITNRFIYDGQEGPEARAYAAFFKQWFRDAKRLDLSINLHNVESGEQPHLSCPMIEPVGERRKQGDRVYALVVNEAAAVGLNMNPRPWTYGTHDFRLGGYLAKFYGPLHMPYEVNGQDKQRHLLLAELKAIGPMLARISADYLSSADAEPLFASIKDTRQRHGARMEQYERIFTERSITNALQIEWACWQHEVETVRKAAKTSVPKRNGI